ncbi:MAG: hypothetical protein KGZ59_05990 [Chitinophagaceae bacterium]|nr:hypothetical protein [Chitinophagaceae bacterium]
MAKDYTKYNVEGVGENFSKSGLVKAIVTDFAKKNKSNYASLLKAFPDELQGKRFVVKKLSEVKEDKKKYEGRYFEKDPIKLSDKEVVVVCNQWGSDNIQPFIDMAESLGYIINAAKKDEITNEEKNEDSNNSDQETNYGSGKLRITISGSMFKLFYCTHSKEQLKQINKLVELSDDFDDREDFIKAFIEDPDSILDEYEEIIEKEGLDKIDEFLNQYSAEQFTLMSYDYDNDITIMLDEQVIYSGDVKKLTLADKVDYLDDFEYDDRENEYKHLVKLINNFNFENRIIINDIPPIYSDEELPCIGVSKNGIYVSFGESIIDVEIDKILKSKELNKKGIFYVEQYIEAEVASTEIDVTNFKMKDLCWIRYVELEDGRLNGNTYAFSRIFHKDEGEINLQLVEFEQNDIDVDFIWKI